MNQTHQQEKAKELIDKFRPYMYCYMGSGMLSNHYDEKVATDNAKYCALLCVDEIIKACPTNPREGEAMVLYSEMIDNSIEFWEEVKKEITNL